MICYAILKFVHLFFYFFYECFSDYFLYQADIYLLSFNITEQQYKKSLKLYVKNCRVSVYIIITSRYYFSQSDGAYVKSSQRS